MNVPAFPPSLGGLTPVSVQDSYALRRTAELLRQKPLTPCSPADAEILRVVADMTEAMARGDAEGFRRHLLTLGFI